MKTINTILSTHNINIKNQYLKTKKDIGYCIIDVDIKEINKAVLKFKKNYKKFSSLISVTPMSETSYKTFEIKNNKLCGVYTNSFKLDKFHKPRQMYPVTYSANGLIDIIKTELILKSNKTHGDKVMPFISNEIYVDIDHLNDLKYAEYIIKIKKYFVPKKND